MRCGLRESPHLPAKSPCPMFSLASFAVQMRAALITVSIRFSSSSGWQTESNTFLARARSMRDMVTTSTPTAVGSGSSTKENACWCPLLDGFLFWYFWNDHEGKPMTFDKRSTTDTLSRPNATPSTKSRHAPPLHLAENSSENGISAARWTGVADGGYWNNFSVLNQSLYSLQNHRKRTLCIIKGSGSAALGKKVARIHQNDKLSVNSPGKTCCSASV